MRVVGGHVVAEVFGCEVAELPKDSIPLAALVLVKYLDEDGDTSWAIRSSKDMSDMEAIGLLRAALMTQERDVLNMWERDSGT